MEHIVHLLKLHSFEDVVVTTAFMPQAIRSYFGSGEGQGVNMSYSVEEAPAGTAGSVRLAADQLDETFLVISGDALCDVDLSALVRFHKEKGASVTIGLVSVDNPLEFGIVVTDEEGRDRAVSREAVVGAGLLRHDQHGHLRARAGGAPSRADRQAVRLLQGAVPAPARHGQAALRICPGRLLARHREPRSVPAGQFRRAGRPGPLNVPAFRLRGNVWLGEGVELDDLEQVEGPAFIGNYCRIAPGGSVGPYAVLGSSVTVRESASVTRSVIDASTYVGRSATIEGAIVGRSCDVRSHVRVHEGAAIGDECTLGPQSVVLPGIRIYPFKEVESGTIVDRNSSGSPAPARPRAAGRTSRASSTSTSLPRSRCGSGWPSAPR